MNHSFQRRRKAVGALIAALAAVSLAGCASVTEPGPAAESPSASIPAETREVLKSDNAPPAIGPYSQGISADGVVYVSGQLPIDPNVGEINNEQSTAEQTALSLANVEAVLKEAGLDLSNVASVTVYLANLDDFKAFNEVYEEYFGTEDAPARATVQVARLPLDAKVEISAIAVK